MTDSQDLLDAQPADVDGADSFDHFVVASASTLIGITRLITGDPMLAAAAGDEAWREVYRRWRRIERTPSPVASALAPFVAASVRSAGRDVTGGVRGLELLDHGLADADTVLAHERLELSIGEALLDLSPRARASLALRWYAGLTDSELARAMRWHPVRPGKLADDALNDVLHTTTAMTVPSHAAVVTRPAPGRQFTQRLRAELADRAGPPVDGRAELSRLRPALSGIRQLRRRPPLGRRTVIAAGVLAAAAVTTALVVVSAGDDGTTSEPRPRPVASAGGQLVGYRTVLATVPGSWTHNHLECGRVVDSTVIYPDAVTGCAGRQREAAAVPPSSVTFGEPPSSPIPLGRLRQINEVGGNQVFATTPIRRKGLLQQVVVIPKANVQMVVRTPDPRVLDDIVDSLQSVPPGYVVVPACTLRPLRDAIGRLVAAGLGVRLTQASTLSMHYGAPPVTHQSIPTGQIVARGTVIGLGFPSMN